MRNHATIWVCIDCLLAHANGDVDEYADKPPLGLLEGDDIALGLAEEEHDQECPEEKKLHEGQCSCEFISFSSRQCGGCGSWLAGERHAMTVFIKEEVSV